MTNDEQLSPTEIASIQAGLKAVEEGLVEFAPSGDVMEALGELWRSDEPNRLSLHERPVQYLSTALEWYVGMSPEFRKATRNIDRKLQGRIFEAISHICKQPTTPKGDTVTPLTSKLKGLWRYRIGDFRLVYHPNRETRHITLITFASRGRVYA